MISMMSAMAVTSTTAMEVDTPPRPTTFPAATPTQSRTPGGPPAYRLLYRGALALPDSLMVLDGLTFAARLDSPAKTPNLLENPLALALESMRGRPTLRSLGLVPLKDVYLDESGRVEMDIHPRAMLAQIYFTNTFCLLPFASSSSHTAIPERSEQGLKVALGDSDGPETTEIVIFAQREPLAASDVIRLHVGRVTARPVQPRAPRPDDPIPRKPPAFFIRDLKRTSSLNNVRDLKRAPSTSTLGPMKRQKTLADLGSGARVETAVFKVPELPRPAKGKGKERDVFGDVSEVCRVKQKGEDGSEAGLEKANKNVIKRLTIEYLGRTKDPTERTRFIDKAHPEFKELYGHIYRGVGFALRANIRQSELEVNLVNRLIDKHALMYLPRP